MINFNKDSVCMLCKNEKQHYFETQGKNKYNIPKEIKNAVNSYISNKNLLECIYNFCLKLINDKENNFKMILDYENDIEDIEEHIKINNFDKLLNNFNMNKNKTKKDIEQLIKIIKEDYIYINNIEFIIFNKENNRKRIKIGFTNFGHLYVNCKCENSNLYNYFTIFMNIILSIMDNN